MAGETLSGTERRVAEIYAAMLEVSDVSADDDIFSLGGDLLQAVRIALEIEREFNLTPTLERMEEFEPNSRSGGLDRYPNARRLQ